MKRTLGIVGLGLIGGSLDLDLKGSRLPADLLLQKALCELGLQTGGRHR